MVTVVETPAPDQPLVIAGAEITDPAPVVVLMEMMLGGLVGALLSSLWKP